MRRIICRLKHELEFILQNSACVAVTVFICAIGGILLWINGGSRFLPVFPGVNRDLSLAIIFAAWLFAYALYGLRLSMMWIFSRCAGRRAAVALASVFLAYLLDLVWYALFFCTHLRIFPLIILSAALCLNLFAFMFSKKGLIIQRTAGLVTAVIEIVFIIYTL